MSPTGDHLFQLASTKVGDQQVPALVDRCRYCGTIAFTGETPRWVD